ncbi:MAG: FlgD immunoglobulin-like domain containing protein [Candidatus Eisenbacteria bacterium]|uniref:FlgD/Vpr Ig-like domain-containing protein n=1 Tax=Eiseniibacteriota bacterium TaxID=2212470 RepID=A0A956M0G6_UNCEI|nr:hypothetical protein [Candidatus Eisenbacteria bacterium]
MLFREQMGPQSVSATIPLALPHPDVVRVTVHDADGRTIRTIFAGLLEAGAHRLGWDGLDADGREIASGSYYLHVAGSAGETSSRTLTVVR